MLRIYGKDIIIFSVIFLILSAVAICFLQWPNWDFYNYHYYIGYAYLNNRIGEDFLAANFHSYVNPYVDALTYFLINRLNNHPYIFLSITTFDNALLLFMTYKITDFLIVCKNKIIKNIFLILVVGYIAFSPMLIDGLNYSMNDVAVADFILISFYIFLKNIFEKSKNRYKLIMLSGALMGISLVLKYTGYLYCIAILFTLLILNKKIPDFKKTAAVYFISVVVSFLIFGSSWLYSIYKLYDNPLFPYLNNIFHSKYYDYIDMSRIDCLGIRPRNLFEIVFYPFLWSSTFLFGSYRMDWDPRYAINVISSIMIALHLIWTRKEEGLYLDIIKRDYLCFLLLFINISYYILVYITGIYRFIIPTSCLFGITALIACVLISKCFKSKDICKLLIFISLFIFVYINSFCTTERNFVMPVKNAKLFYNDEKYDIQDGSKVLLLNPITSYFTAGQNKNAQYLGFVIPKHIYKKYEDYLKKEEPISWFAHYMFSDYLENLIKETVTKSENKIYIIYSDSSYFEDVYKEALDFYSNGRRKMENCRKISYKGLVYFNYAEANLCEYNMI